MRSVISSFFVALLAIAPIACAASTETPADTTSGEDEELKAAKVITEADQGKTIQIATGQPFSIQLPSNPTTGYSWAVTSVDRTLGQPKESFVSSGGAVGSGGTQRFTWSTKSPLSLEGKHDITLAYRRPWETTTDPVKTFSVTVEIGHAANCGTHPACGTSEWCSFCWGQLACIPKGALC